jgi:Uma2 family endonuclease
MAVGTKKATTSLYTHKWTINDYYKMAEVGLFYGKRVELIEGEVIKMSPIGRPHVITVKTAAHVLEVAFGDGWFVQTQAPLRLLGTSEPEPDIAVVRGVFEEFEEHPTTAELVVEVSDSTYYKDSRLKASFYAKAGIADYWVINVDKRQLEVFRQPTEDDEAEYGFSYGSRQLYKIGESVSPLAKPSASVLVVNLLPRKPSGGRS